MVSPTSILRHLPPQLNSKQALFLDGIRHAVEIAQFAYGRLEKTLTDLALHEPTGSANPDAFTSAFLDAWAFVDAVDRFRCLWKLMPGVQILSPPPNDPMFRRLKEPIRELRNIADHLAQRAEYVVASRGAALGVLTWCTFTDDEGNSGVSCALLPGTIASASVKLVNPADETAQITKTGRIHLEAGEYRACLSNILPELELRISEIEEQLETQLGAAGLEGQQAGSDCFIAMRFTSVEPPIAG